MSAFDTPKTAAMRNFLKKEKGRVTGLSIEPDGVFIYTDSEQWQDDAGAGTWREDSETAAIKDFYSTVQPGIKNTMRRKNPVRKYFQLYDVANDYSLSPVPGKYQFGDLAHAKKQAQDLIDKWVAGMKTRAGKLSAYKIKWQRGAAAGIRPESKMEYNGFIHDGELVYKIIERAKNPVKKKTRKKANRKGNPERITQAWIEKRVSLLNDMMGRPQAAYTKKADGGMTGNRGHLFIDHAYGGVKVAEMAGNGTGENNISDGYVPKKELNNFINGMIAAVRLMERKNPHTRNKPTRKKNPVGAVKPRGFIVASFAPVYNEVVYALDSNGARMDFRKTNAKVWKTQKGAGAAAVNIANGWGEPVVVAPINTSVKQIESYFPGVRKRGKGARRRNPVGPTQREIDQAGELFKDFTGNAPDNLQKVRIRNPKTGLVIGELDGVLYTTIRDGKTEKYKHDFKKGNRPHLVSAHDGQSLHILGGDYEFTERGIEG